MYTPCDTMCDANAPVARVAKGGVLTGVVGVIPFYKNTRDEKEKIRKPSLARRIVSTSRSVTSADHHDFRVSVPSALPRRRANRSNGTSNGLATLAAAERTGERERAPRAPRERLNFSPRARRRRRREDHRDPRVLLVDGDGCRDDAHRARGLSAPARRRRTDPRARTRGDDAAQCATTAGTETRNFIAFESVAQSIRHSSRSMCGCTGRHVTPAPTLAPEARVSSPSLAASRHPSVEKSHPRRVVCKRSASRPRLVSFSIAARSADASLGRGAAFS